MSTILEMALDVLLERIRKERFAVGRKPRRVAKEGKGASSSRHVPDAVKRAVYERDGGRCTFTDEQGRRCAETGDLEVDHVDGFARTGRHDVDGLRLLCRAHNQYAAEQMYGRAFMEKARAARKSAPTCPGTSCEPDSAAVRDGGLTPSARDVQLTGPGSGGPAPPP